MLHAVRYDRPVPYTSTVMASLQSANDHIIEKKINNAKPFFFQRRKYFFFQQHKKIYVPNCRDNKSIYRDNKCTK